MSRRARAAQRLALAEAPGRLTAVGLARLTQRDDWAAGYRPTASSVRENPDGSRGAYITLLAGHDTQQAAELIAADLMVALPAGKIIYQAPTGQHGAYLYVYDQWAGAA